MTATWPSRIDYDTATYWRGLSESRLLIARCLDCGNWIHPPRACCSECWSDRIEHQEPSGDATLYSYISQGGAAGGPPQVIAWGELVEQKRLLVVAELKGTPLEAVRIGARLKIEWEPQGNFYLPFFRQTGES